MNYHKITKASMIDGLGVRTVLWLSGCEHHCPGCHNPETWDPKSGILFDNQAKQQLFKTLSKSYIKGITFSGGDPLCYCNRAELRNLIQEIKEKYPQKDIWIYTGYTYEEIKENQELYNMIQFCDYLVEGRYQQDLRDITLPFRGSSNQNIYRRINNEFQLYK